jgi:selenocysteine lyase/cysteine desulfurase
VIHWARRYAEEGVFCGDAYLEAVDQSRAALARLLDADPRSLAFFQSTACAISQVAFQLGLEADDDVVLWDQEYASNLYPWRAACERAGARLILVPSGPDLATPFERILEALTPRTRAVGISWVQFQTGAVTDLEPVVSEARKRGIWTVLDVIQGAGALPLSFRRLGVDAICGGSHKWLAAPVGVGYLLISEDRARELRPHSVGAYTFGTSEDLPDSSRAPRSDALRFEAGSKQVLEIVALGASAALLHEVGIPAISAEVLRLAQMLADKLRLLGYAVAAPNGLLQRSGIVNFKPGERSPLKSIEAAADSLTRHRISFARRGPGLRLSPHAHNSEEDVARALEVLGRA